VYRPKQGPTAGTLKYRRSIRELADPRTTLSTTEAARYVGVSRQSVFKRIEADKMPATVDPLAPWYSVVHVAIADLDVWIKRRETR